MADAGGIRAGRAYVEVGSNQTALEKGLRDAEAKVRAFGDAVAGIGMKLAAIGGAITAPFVAAAKTFAESGAALLNMSTRTGVSVESLSALGFAATQTGTDLGMVEVALRKMSKAMTAGSLESAQAQATFAQLGLSVQQLMKLSPDQQFLAVSRAIAQIPNPTARAGAAMMVFGRTGTMMLPLIENLQTLTDQAKEFGLVTSTEAAEAGHKLEQSFGLLTATLKKIVTTVGGALAPLLEEWNVTMARSAVTVKEYVLTHKDLINSIFKTGAVVAGAGIALVTLGHAIGAISSVLGVATAAFSLFHATMALMVSPAGMIVAVLAAAGVALFKFTSLGSQATTFLGDKFGGLLTIAKDTFQGIADALKAGDIDLAAKVLWAGLNVEWRKGVKALSDIWNDWGLSVREAFASVSQNIAASIIDFTAEVQTQFATFTGGLTGSWGDMIRVMVKQLSPLGTILAKLLRVDVDKALNQALSGIGLTAGGPNPELDKKLAEIEAQRAEAQKALEGQGTIDTEARRKAAEAASAEAAKGLADAQAELDRLRGVAAGKAAGAKPPEAARPGTMPEAFTPEGLDQAMDKAKEKAKIDIAGSFSAAALAGLGAGQSRATVQEDQLKEQKQTNNHLQKLNRKAQVGQLVFG